MRIANCNCYGNRGISAYGTRAVGTRRVGEFEAEATATGGVTAALTEPSTAAHSIFVGVTTGVLVWTATNILNSLFGSKK